MSISNRFCTSIQRLVWVGLISFLATLFVGLNASALAVPAAPPLERPIVDQANILSPEQENALVSQINQSRQEKSYQLGILTVKSLEGAPIENYALEAARKWGIGEKQSNNGVLLLISVDDREMRIETGTGVEGDLTDARSRRIIDNAIAPEFKDGNYYEGISIGVQQIHDAMMNRAETAATARPAENPSKGIFSALPYLTFGFVWLASIMARSKSWWAGGVVGGIIGSVIGMIAGWGLGLIVSGVVLAGLGLLLDYAVSKNYKKHKNAGDSPAWWAGGMGGWGGGSSGGFGGFGGGGFGGGGASGRW